MSMNTVTCLKASMLSEEYKGAMAGEIATLRHPDDLKRCVELSSRALDHHGRVVAVMWRGTEVAIFFKREVVKADLDVLKLGPSAKILESDRDAWIILDTMANHNVNATVKVLMDKLTVAEAQLKEYERLFKVQALQSDQAVAQVQKVQVENAKLQELVDKLRSPAPTTKTKPKKKPIGVVVDASHSTGKVKPVKQAKPKPPAPKKAGATAKRASKRAKKAS